MGLKELQSTLFLACGLWSRGSASWPNVGRLAAGDLLPNVYLSLEPGPEPLPLISQATKRQEHARSTLDTEILEQLGREHAAIVAATTRGVRQAVNRFKASLDDLQSRTPADFHRGLALIETAAALVGPATFNVHVEPEDLVDESVVAKVDELGHDALVSERSVLQQAVSSMKAASSFAIQELQASLDRFLEAAAAHSQTAPGVLRGFVSTREGERNDAGRSDPQALLHVAASEAKYPTATRMAEDMIRHAATAADLVMSRALVLKIDIFREANRAAKAALEKLVRDRGSVGDGRAVAS